MKEAAKGAWDVWEWSTAGAAAAGVLCVRPNGFRPLGDWRRICSPHGETA